MQLSAIDLSIIFGYIVLTVALGMWVSKLASKSLRSYFLAGNKLPWWVLGLSNASGMFDVAGTMWMVGLMVVYGVKSLFIPWVWPVFNQIFLMMFLAVWLRRSAKLTGAEWINFRFGEDGGAKASHFVNVAFALIAVVGMIAYGFLGIGKLAAEFIPYQFSADPLLNDKIYGVIIVALTTLYSVKGGMYAVVVTEILQFFVKFFVCIGVAILAMQLVTPEMLKAVVPDGWHSLAFGTHLNLDWVGQANSGAAANQVVAQSAAKAVETEGYALFAAFLGLVFFQGFFKSLAGPVPNYDMQRLLSAKSPSDAAKISAFVNVTLLFPRYLMIAGLAVLALAFIGPEWTRLKAEAAAQGVAFKGDFDTILPFVISHLMPPGFLGLVLAGMLSAFMASYSASLNAAPAYIVNDIYKKYLRPDAEQKVYVRLSYIVSTAFAVIGTAIGWQLTSINEIVAWIATGLFGGYTAANVIKWYWWRFNGTGYFVSMALGVGIALLLPVFKINELQAFPFAFALCCIAAVGASLLTPATPMPVLKEFYLKTRPWGFWGPVHEALKADQPDVQPNRDFKRDMMNVAIGLVWQSAITAAGMFVILREWKQLAVATATTLVATIVLKFTWWDRLRDEP